MREPRHIAVLGSTGSIGRNTLEVVARSPERFRVDALSAHSNVALLREQIALVRPRRVAVVDAHAAAELKESLGGAVDVLAGAEGVCELAATPEVDTVVNALVGFAGLRPTIEAITRGKTVALANKETLVVAGELITELLARHNAALVPVDSEHSAILQCLSGEEHEHIERLILTASGGPFLHRPRASFATITVEDALRHPTWRMGKKITIDSATLMNKGLEVIEAHWLFRLPVEKIAVLVHPQSIIHSMVEFVDGSIKAQLGVPDMKIPIQYALTYPGRFRSIAPRLDFAALREMTFLVPDMATFECLPLAYEALRLGGTAPAILNAANEVAVDLFLKGKIRFPHIALLIRDALQTIARSSASALDAIVDADHATRTHLREAYPRLTTSHSVLMPG